MLSLLSRLKLKTGSRPLNFRFLYVTYMAVCLVGHIVANQEMGLTDQKMLRYCILSFDSLSTIWMIKDGFWMNFDNLLTIMTK